MRTTSSRAALLTLGVFASVGAAHARAATQQVPGGEIREAGIEQEHGKLDYSYDIGGRAR